MSAILAISLLRPDTEEYFRAAFEQISVYPVEGSGRSYEDILNEYGLTLFENAKKRYKQNDIKDEITSYTIKYERSGGWAAAVHSKYKWITYEDEGEIKGMVCSWNNRSIIGTMKNVQAQMVTSLCIFITKEWCLTKSGNIYKLTSE